MFGKTSLIFLRRVRLRVCLKILFGIWRRTNFPFYFSCLDTRKVTKNQEILNSPAAQTTGFQENKYILSISNDL
jgi:hypothetical protein